MDLQKIDELVRSQSSPEPFSGVIYISDGDELLFAGEYGLAIRSLAAHMDLGCEDESTKFAKRM